MSNFDAYFSIIYDTRQQGKVQHRLLDVLFIIVAAGISGCNEWDQIALFGLAREAWLRQYIELPNGVPSVHTLRRVLGFIDPAQFEKCFCRWTRELVRHSKGDIVAIDGKTVRGAYKDDQRRSPIHLVSAWSEANGLVLGQVKTDEKSNEITAIPELLDLLMIKGCIVTIDAMGTQKEIAKKIVKDKKADYVLALKGNQGNIHDAVSGYFEDALKEKFAGVDHESYKTVEKGHGRIEKRNYYLLTDLGWLPERKAWYGLAGVGMVVSTVTQKGKTSTDKRFFLCSITTIGAFTKAVREHWGIESMHWTLDVTFKEDASRIRADNEPENFALLRKVTRNILMIDKKNDPEKKKQSTNIKRLAACFDVDVLDRILIRNLMETEED